MPLYENSESLYYESCFMQDLANHWGYTITKLSISEMVDAVCTDDTGRIVAYLEVKIRTHVLGEYRDVWIDRNKAIKGLQLAHKEEVPFLFAVRWDGHDGFYQFEGNGELSEKEQSWVREDGLTVPRDDNDIDWIVGVPVFDVDKLKILPSGIKMKKRKADWMKVEKNFILPKHWRHSESI